MSLAITRRTGESFYLHLKNKVDTERLLRKLQTEGIEIRIGDIQGSSAKIYIDAPEEISILREELLWK